MPFTAQIAAGDRVVSMLNPDDAAVIANPLSRFCCKGCGADMFIRRGTYSLTGDVARRAHFAHRPSPPDADGPKCPMAAYESGETEAHRRVKALLAADLAAYIPALRNDPPSYVELECWLPDARRVADVYVDTTSGQQLAVEVQLSAIPTETLRERSEAYLTANITPVWLFADGRMTDGCERVLDELNLDWLVATIVFAPERREVGRVAT